MKLIIQIPCLNEEEFLPQTVKDLPKNIDGISKIEVMVINDGSTDRTSEVARSVGVDHVIDIPYNYGLSNAFIRGIKEGYKRGADIIVNTDADNQYSGEDIGKLVKPIIEGRAQMVIGDRQTMALKHFDLLKRLLQKIGSFVVSLMAGIKVPDATSGFRAFSRSLCEQLILYTNFSYTLETIIMCGKSGIQVLSVPIKTNPPTRPSRLFRSIPEYIFKSMHSMLKIYLMYTSSTLFAALGVFFFALGFIPILRFLIIAIFVSPEGHIQSLVFGAILFFLGGMSIVSALIISNINSNRKLLREIYLQLFMKE